MKKKRNISLDTYLQNCKNVLEYINQLNTTSVDHLTSSNDCLSFKGSQGTEDYSS